MRLVDADALLKSHCIALDGEYESCKECLEPPYGCCCLEIKGEDIYNAPTIDAIPVEWLNERHRKCCEEGDTDLMDAITVLCNEYHVWQKEQETR